MRVIVLTGSGRAFSAGGDLKSMASGEAEAPALPPKGDYADLLLRFVALGKPTIARVNGYAYGGGLGLVASCDFAIAKKSASMGTPEIDRGLFPMMIMAVLGRILSRRRLMEMMLLGDKLSAERAEELELITRAVDDERLDETVDALAARLAEKSPTAVRMGLAAYHQQATARCTTPSRSSKHNSSRSSAPTTPAKASPPSWRNAPPAGPAARGNRSRFRKPGSFRGLRNSGSTGDLDRDLPLLWARRSRPIFTARSSRSAMH